MSSANRNYKSGEELLQSLIMNIRGIVKISQLYTNPLKPTLFKAAFWLWIILLSILILCRIPPFLLIIEIKDLLISLLPGILGFTIGGYSILIGFTQPELIKKISGPRKDSIFSLYQLASASFASNILIQAFVLIMAYLIHIITWIDLHKKVIFKSTDYLILLVNWAILSILLLGFITSIIVIIQLIVNVFNFSQLYHYNINKTHLDSLKDVKSNEIDSNI
ncbi:hypothetical protein ACQKLP_23805 [Chitinophaga sp. NPDC101104]|uniref:hypothetical protein n=1 Tax=Chitinophaga sp. NPDC101104 TaxID=3390561 RepID=UPI003D03259F